jgi:type I restriction enzyme M protein
MRWVAPSENEPAPATLEKRLWDAADQFCANSKLKAQACAGSILGIN